MIHLDFETYSELDVTVVGAYRYAEHPSTEVLVACWAIDDGAVARWVPHLHGPRMPAALRSAVLAGHHVSAHNVQFERAIWRSVLTQRQGWVAVPLHRWHCTAARAAAVGFPRSLADAAIAAELPAEYLKDKRGKELIKLFCGPRKPTKTDKRTRMLPDDNPGAFEDFCDYCAQDVVAERALDAYLPPLPRRERAVFMADIQINETGMPLDTDLLQKCESVVRDIEAGIDNRTKELTGGLRPTQRDKLIEWLHANGCTLPDLTLDTVRNAVDGKGDIYITDNVREVLELRIEASRASTKKLHAMRTCASPADGRVRGAYLYGGAHTLRFCLAEGTLVYVKEKDNIRLQTVETILPGALVWDGTAWVSCEGAQSNGVKNTIYYTGIDATEEHGVWKTPTEKITLGDAANLNAELWISYPEELTKSMNYSFRMASGISVLAITQLLGLGVDILKLLVNRVLRSFRS